MQLPNIAARVFDTPLMIARHKLEAIVSVLSPRLSGEVPKIEALTVEERPKRKSFQLLGATAVIPIQGTLVHRTVGLEALSGLTSYETISKQFDDALNDSEVAQIVIDADSPGGEVSGVFDLADRIYHARGEKRIVAIVDEQAFSAMYAIASAADEIVVPRTGGVGSVGVIAALMSQQKFDERLGVEYETIFAGARKNDFNPHEAIKNEAVAALTEHVNEIYGLFVDTVARNRGMTPAAVKATQAGLFMGKAALKVGFADRMTSAQDALRGLLSQPRRKLSMTTKAETANPDATQSGDNVIDFQAEVNKARDAARLEAEAAAKARAKAVTDLCLLAGMPEMSGEMIASDKAEDEIRVHLCALKAKADEESAVSGLQAASTGMDISQSWTTAFAKVGK